MGRWEGNTDRGNLHKERAGDTTSEDCTVDKYVLTGNSGKRQRY